MSSVHVAQQEFGLFVPSGRVVLVVTKRGHRRDVRVQM